MDIGIVLLMAYVLGGSIWPQIVRQKQLFLIGAIAVIAAMLLGIPHFWIFQYLGRLAEVAAFAVLVVAAGGTMLSQGWRQIFS